MTADEERCAWIADIRDKVRRCEDCDYGYTPMPVIHDVRFLLKEIDRLTALIREQDHRIECLRR